jgi:hypothetical protein
VKLTDSDEIRRFVADFRPELAPAVDLGPVIKAVLGMLTDQVTDSEPGTAKVLSLGIVPAGKCRCGCGRRHERGVTIETAGGSLFVANREAMREIVRALERIANEAWGE